ncbi:MAG: hypothetical protein JO202_02030 [Ktedonobacteraceae bacterium]|nr:hypothetical protein [Ktedonobacteraceae bacterium]
MAERPYSRYTRAKTWAGLYSQHINAGYALVPYSATNNSIGVIRCKSPEETQATMRDLLNHAQVCAAFYAMKQPPEDTPTILAKVRHAVVLARSSDYYHYHLADHAELSLVVCGLHDSYLHLPVWEMRTNQRYAARETAVPISSPDFDRIRRTQFGHNILLGALVNHDQKAQAFLETLPKRTQRRILCEKEEVQDKRYRGRPLAFLTETERREIGSKISQGLRRYHQRLKAL